ncbi:MAG: hypothetical protein L6E13_03265 [Firmicutes bacterium]|nr:hypothetical protein [Bacillota bacterium]
MRLITFDPLRAVAIPGARYIKPELVFRYRADVLAADWLLFPEEWQVNFLVYGWHKRIFPSPASYHLGRDKVEQTRALWAVAPEAVPDTLILPNSPAGQEEALAHFSFPFVAKIPRASMGQGVFRIENMADWQAYCAATDVLYVQEYLPIDRDLRVVWVGDQILAHYWRVGRPGAFHNNVARGGRIDHSPAPRAALELVEHVARTLGIDHAGFDVAVVDGEPYILEFNVKFGNLGLRELGIAVGPAILAYLKAQEAEDSGRPGEPSPSQPTTPPVPMAS